MEPDHTAAPLTTDRHTRAPCPPDGGTRLPWSSSDPVLPLVALDGPLGERVAALGARQIDLYRSLAHTPALLDAWIEFTWVLRRECVTPRALRELMILRTAVVMRSEYEWHQHRLMAADAGVPMGQVQALAAWQTSDLFDERDRGLSRCRRRGEL